MNAKWSMDFRNVYLKSIQSFYCYYKISPEVELLNKIPRLFLRLEIDIIILFFYNDYINPFMLVMFEIFDHSFVYYDVLNLIVKITLSGFLVTFAY